jgi:hypothetical protein
MTARSALCTVGPPTARLPTSEWMSNLDPQAENDIYRRTAQLLEADIANELVALDPEQGKCFGFNDVATDVWRKLERPRTFAELKKELLADYDVSDEECANDLRALLDQMRAARLIDRVS